MELKQWRPPETLYLLLEEQEIMGASVWPPGKCNRREASGVLLLRPDVSKLRNMPEPERSTESL